MHSGKISPPLYFAFCTFWLEGESKTRQVELYIIERIVSQNWSGDQLKTGENLSHIQDFVKLKLYTGARIQG